MIWGGKLDSKLSLFTSLVTKINYANQYGRLRYSTRAYPSPALTNDEWEILYKILGEALGEDFIPDDYDGDCWYCDTDYESGLSEEWRKIFRDRYIDRPTYFNGEEEIITQEQYEAALKLLEGMEEDDAPDEDEVALPTWTWAWDKEFMNGLFLDEVYAMNAFNIEGMENTSEYYDADGDMRPGKEGFYQAKAAPQYVVWKIRNEISRLSQLGEVRTNINDLEVVDRMEKCLVTNRDGLIIDTKAQLDNLFRYYANDKSSTYTIYYDAKTMLPLVHVVNDQIQDSKFKIKIGTVYYKWTRTVKYQEYDDDGILGRSFVIDSDTFPADYRIVGETYIRNQKTGKDQRCQIIIYKANVSSDTSITLQADGDPTTFTMTIDVLSPENDILMELRELDVEEDIYEGGTRILPQRAKYTYTPGVGLEEVIVPPVDNNEIY